MSTLRRLATALLATTIGAAVIVGAPIVPGLGTPPAQAAEASQFSPGNIVSDSVFYNSESMSVAQVQAFLDQRGANCVAGEQPCLKDIRTDSRTWAAETGLCRGYTGRAQESAAAIIVGVAQSCGINPRVLLVLLEKEQALVGRTRPTNRAYQIAAGFGCPDNAPCNAEYYGFFNQVYRAARQFQIYRSNPARYGYQAGRSNYIQWNPNAACGGTNVHIDNQATAALYIYTPYQPNAAAMRNLYGTGDSCSSYGNRNFWRLFTDWFGDPRHESTFVRTSSDATVWLVNGSTRHRVTSLETLSSYSRLGGVAVVSASYLGQLAAGPDLGNVVLDQSTGNVLFVNSNIGLRMTSCTQVADFGASCASLPALSASQVRNLYAGPTMTNGYESTDGRRWYVAGGVRREVFDTAALSASSLPTSSVRLTFSGIAGLPLGAPVLRDGVVIAERGTQTAWIWTDGRRHEAPLSAVTSQSTLAGLPRSSLDAASIATLSPGLHLTGTVAGTDGRRYLLTSTGLSPLASTSTFTPTSPTWSPAFLARFPATASVAAAPFLRESGPSTVVQVRSAQAREISTWADLVAISGTTTPVVHVVPDGLLRHLATRGPVAIAAGSLVKSPDAAEVYYSTDTNTLVHVDDLAVTGQLGVTAIRSVPQASIAAATRLPSHLTPIVRCGSGTFVAAGGRLQQVAVGSQAGLPVTPLGTTLCATLPRAAGSAVPPVFVKTAHSPNIHHISGGVRRHVLSWAGLMSLTGGAAPTIVVIGTPTLQPIPVGATIG